MDGTLLYSNNLKSGEFDKEAPQNFCSERVTIAERQGTRENRNYEVKLTQLKLQTSSCLSIYQIEPSQLQGSVTIPPSKSHTLRAILFASLARGISKIEGTLPSPDTKAMIDAVRLLGAKVTGEGKLLCIEGVAGTPSVAEDVIQCGNSGLVLRLIGALAGLIPHYTILTGDASIRHHRPILPLLDALQQLGVFATSARGDGYAPMLIRGPFVKDHAVVEGCDSQPISGLLIAGAFAPHPIELHVQNPGEKPWIDLTLDWFKRVGISYQAKEYTHYRMEGRAQIDGFTYRVPGDFSSAAFPIAAALLTNSELSLHNLDMEDVQGDKAIVSLLQKMGARVMIDREKQMLTIEKGQRLKGIQIDINDCIDALPIMAVIGCFAEGETEIVNGAIAREKESDRIHGIACELRKMGALIEERPDGLLIRQSQLHGAELTSHRDHRLALSLSVAAMAARGTSTIYDVACIEKSYPTFCRDFRRVGAVIR